MTFLAVLVAFLSGALGAFALSREESVHGGRADVLMAAFGFTASLVLAWAA